jgi:putative transcriptional regulator
MEVTVGQLMRQVLEEDLDIAEPIYHGGPVEGPIVVVHEQEVEGASLVEPGVYLSSDQEQFAAICAQSAGRYRVFNGYAGWAPQQLDEELKHGGWLLWKITKEELFTASDEIWQSAIRQIGRDILTESIAAGRIPDDPSTN